MTAVDAALQEFLSDHEHRWRAYGRGTWRRRLVSGSKDFERECDAEDQLVSSRRVCVGRGRPTADRSRRPVMGDGQ